MQATFRFPRRKPSTARKKGVIRRKEEEEEDEDDGGGGGGGGSSEPAASLSLSLSFPAAAAASSRLPGAIGDPIGCARSSSSSSCAQKDCAMVRTSPSGAPRSVAFESTDG